MSGSPTEIQPILDAVAANAVRLGQALDATLLLRDGDAKPNFPSGTLQIRVFSS
jgi:hypothetical protein